MIKKYKKQNRQKQGMSRKGFPAFFLPKNEMEDYYMRDYTNF